MIQSGRVLLLLFCLVGCGRRDAAPDVSGADRPGTLIVALQSNGKTLDPHRAGDAASFRLVENMYSTLFRYAPEYGRVEPDLVTDWEVSDDQTVYRFRLRTNAVFHSDRAVTAEDVQFSLNRIREEGVRSSQFDSVQEIRIPSPHEVELHLSEPYAPLLTILAHPMNAIVDRDRVESPDFPAQLDAGSGPYQLDAWQPGRSLRLTRHADYHEKGRPRMAVVEFRPISDETARTIALRNGEIDILLDVAGRDIPLLENKSHLNVTSVPGTFWEYVGLNTRTPPFDKVAVRQALAHAVDREAMNQLVTFGQGTVLNGGHIPPNHWAHAKTNLYPEANLEKARTLLSEAGYPDGFELTVKVGSDFPYQVKAAQILKQQLRPLQIDVRVLSLESGLFFDALGQGDFQATIVGWLGFVDPDEWTYNLFHSEGAWNQQGYSNPDVDRLLEKGRRILDRDQRKDIYQEAQLLIARDAPMIFLYANDRTSATLRTIEGFDTHPTVTTLSLRNTKRVTP